MDQAATQFVSTPFASTGPQGHRGRMRSRLLSDESALADYEILEMLLFLGIPRRDTKPLAKALINRFGSLAAAVSAAPEALGLPPQAVAALAMVTQSAAALARPENRERPTLDGWEALIRHLAPARRRTEPPGFSALLLNSRNQLLAEPAWPASEGQADAATLPRLVLRQALDRHASALLLVHQVAGRPRLTAADRALHAAVCRAAAPLTVTVHDLVVIGQGDWTSLRQSGFG